MPNFNKLLCYLSVILLALISIGCDVVAREALEAAKKKATEDGVQVTIKPPNLTITSPVPVTAPTPAAEGDKPTPPAASAAPDVALRHLVVTSLLAQLCSFNGAQGQRVVNDECFDKAMICVSELDQQLPLGEMMRKTINCAVHWDQGK